MLISETYIDATRNLQVGSADPYGPFTDDVGALFRSLSREYGRCTSRVYIDGPATEPMAIGWVFQKRREYDDTRETYLAETWIVLHEAQPDKHTEFHYHFLS